MITGLPRPVQDSRQPLLALRGVRKAYGERVVLDNVTLDVPAHHCLVLIGASGSGKSTLLRAINLLDEIDDGSIMFGDTDIAEPVVDANAIRARMGMVFQAYNLFPHLRVVDNVALPLRLVRGVPKHEARRRGEALLERVGLAHRSRAYPDQLSGGEQQRAAIARALAGQPELLLLDEVTSALDPELVGEVLDLLLSLREDGRTMVVATHEMGFARQIADTVCFLADGRVHEIGDPTQVFDAPREDRTREFLRRVSAGN